MRWNVLVLLKISFALQIGTNVFAAETLKAGVQQFESSIDNMSLDEIRSSNTVRPLHPHLWKGYEFDKQLVERLLKEDHGASTFWYRIPSWCAGKWQSQSATTTYMKDNQSGKEEHTPTTYQCIGRETIGHQFDRQKGIWNFCREYVWTHGQMQDYETHSFLFYSHPLRVTQQEVVVRGKMAVFEVNTKGKIISSYKTEVIDTMTPVDETSFLDRQTKLVFNDLGKPVSTIKTDVLWRKASDFQPVESSKGMALKPIFTQFLQEQGLKDLIE